MTQDRNSQYGNPEDNFRNILNLWNAYKPGAGFTLMDVPMLMVLVKVARISTNPTHRDSLVDTAGYAACAADIQMLLLEEERKAKLQKEMVDMNLSPLELKLRVPGPPQVEPPKANPIPGTYPPRFPSEAP